MVLATGCRPWYWRRAAGHGTGDRLQAMVLATGCRAWYWRRAAGHWYCLWTVGMTNLASQLARGSANLQELTRHTCTHTWHAVAAEAWRYSVIGCSRPSNHPSTCPWVGVSMVQQQRTRACVRTSPHVCLFGSCPTKKAKEVICGAGSSKNTR